MTNYFLRCGSSADCAFGLYFEDDDFAIEVITGLCEIREGDLEEEVTLILSNPANAESITCLGLTTISVEELLSRNSSNLFTASQDCDPTTH